MPDGAKLATAYYELIPSMAGAQSKISAQLAPAAAGAGGSGGAALGSALLGGLKKFAGPIAVIAAGFSVKKIVSESTEAFESLAGTVNSLQRVAGGTKEQVSGLQGALQLSGVDSGKAAASLTIFAKQLSKTTGDSAKSAALTKTLGTNFRDAAGNILPMSQILPGVADKFKSMPDGATKTALAVQLFGRSGTQLLPFLNKGSSGIADLTAKATSMGLVIDDVSAKTFANARVSARTYAASIQGLKVTLGGALLPVLDGVQNVFRNAMIPIITTVTGVIAKNRDAFVAAGEKIDAFADKVGGAVTGIIGFISGAKSAPDLAAALGLDKSSALVGVLGTIKASVGGAFGAIGASVRSIGSAIGPVFAALGPTFASLVPQLLQLFSALSPTSLLLKSLAPILPSITGLLISLGAAIGGALQSTLSAILPPLLKLATTLTGVLSGALATIIPVIVRVAVALAGTLSQVLPVVAAAVGQLATVIGGALGTALSTLAPVIGQVAGILGSALQTTIAALLPVFTQLAPVIGTIATTLGTVLGSVIQAVVPIIGLLAGVLTTVLTAVAPLIPTLLQLIVPILGLIAPLLQLIAPLIRLATAILIPLITLFAALLKPILALIAPLLSLLVPAITAVVKVLTLVVTAIVRGITYFVALVTGSRTAQAGISAAWGAIGAFFSGIWSKIVGFFTSGISKLTGVVGTLKNGVVNAIKGAGTWLLDAGKSIVDGLIKGITSKIDGAKDAIKGVVSAISNFLPHSPAKEGPLSGKGWTTYSGASLATGFADGITSGTDGVRSAMSRMTAMPNVASISSSARAGLVAASSTGNLPSSITLLDADGSILTRAKVLADNAVTSASKARATALATGTRRR